MLRKINKIIKLVKVRSIKQTPNITRGIVIGITSGIIYTQLTKKTYEEISLNELKSKTDLEHIKIIDNNTAIIKQKYTDLQYKVQIPNFEFFKDQIQTDVPIFFQSTQDYDKVLPFIFSMSVSCVFLYFLSKSGSPINQFLNIDKIKSTQSNIRFSDVIGQQNAKKMIMEYVHILKNREKYSSMGVQTPKGALLHGPPGTGKTLLAKAVAGESELPFLSVCASEFNAMFVGVGSLKVKNLYKNARNLAQEKGGCVIFIDEIDAIAQKRSTANVFNSNNERENTLNQLLSEMDGFESSCNIMCFIATNRPETLDPAILRPGRIDRKIPIELPMVKEREEIFQFYLDKLQIDKRLIVRLSQFGSKLTPTYSGADIANVCNEAGIIAVRRNHVQVNEDNFKEAIEYISYGNIKNVQMLDTDKTTLAFHEAGHAFMSYVLPDIPNPIQISILPREKGMLGYSQTEYTENILLKKTQIEKQILVCMAGRAAEQLFCDDVTIGSSNDIEKATELSKKYIEIFGFHEDNKFMYIDKEIPYQKSTSTWIKNMVDQKSLSFLNYKYQECIEILRNNKTIVIELKDELLAKETLYDDDIRRILIDSCV